MEASINYLLFYERLYRSVLHTVISYTFRNPRKNSPLIFLVAAMKDSPPPGCRAFFHIAINLFLINNLHLQKTVATFRSSVFAEPAFCGYSPIFFSRTVLFEPADHIGCKPRATTHLLRVVLQRSLFRRLPPFLLVQRFFRLLHTEDHSYAMCSVVFPTFNLPPPPTPSWQPGLGYAPAAGAPPQKSSGKSSPRRLPFHLVVQLPFAL